MTIQVIDALGPFRLTRGGNGKYRIDGPHGLFRWTKDGCPFEAMKAMVDAYRSWHEATLLQRVYFIGENYDVGGLVKIGISFDPAKRLRELQVSNPKRLSILAITYGGRAEEIRMHSKYADRNIKGEWFSVDRKLRDEMINMSRTIESHLDELLTLRKSPSDDDIIALLR
ncbi:GIY-YIG nuclease family protein [Rhizobium sp. NPDC090275]|uniref:GIY-YIG nuclease family protein n=1 Tax=Rhizobium sp. NPDC090275 TaxID=3364498 RepID=UPI00383B84D7